MDSTTRTCGKLLVIGLVLGLTATASAQEISWRTDYDRARQEAVEQGRPIVIDFTTDNCYWCRQLESRTFTDPGIAQTLNARCIPLRVNASHNPQLTQALNIQSYPTLVYAAPDGKILGYHEGFLEAPKLKDHLDRVVKAVADPEWMLRDYRDAVQAQSVSDFPRLVTLLRNILEDGKTRPIQQKARKLLQEVEHQAASRLENGKKLVDQGRTTEAYEAVRAVVKDYHGTLAARKGGELLVQLASRSSDKDPERAEQAQALLAQAREDYKAQLLICCIDRCELLLSRFGDLPEGAEARQLLADLRSSPGLASKAAEQMTDRLGTLYLGLANAAVDRGEPQQAVVYLQKVVATCPNTRQAEMAQARLAQLQGPSKP